MSTAALFTRGATFSVVFLRYFFAAVFFSSSATSGSAAVFLTEKAAALQRCFLSKCSAAAATPNKLLPRLFWFTFSHVIAWNLYSPFVFTLLLLPRYFSLVEHTRLPLWRFVVARICVGEFYRTWSYFFLTKLERIIWLVAGQFDLIKPISIKPISNSISLTKMR